MDMGRLLQGQCSLVVLYLFLNIQAAQAQRNAVKIQTIEKTYQQVRVGISQKKLLLNQATINLKRHNLNHSGYYHYSEKFYYLLAQAQHNTSPLLQLALVRQEKENIDYQKEFLFNPQGELVYFHEKQNDSKKFPYREVKVYFERGKMLVWNQGHQNSPQLNVIQSPKKKIQLIIKEAKELQQKLKKQLEEL